MAHEFTSKHVVITGGAGGIGRTTAEAFASHGAQVTVLDKNAEGLAAFKKDFPQINTVEVDCADWGKVQAAVSKLGPIDHLVNNAGIAIVKGLGDLTEADVDRIVNINFKAAISVTQAAVKQMPEGSTIVNVGSMLSSHACPGGPMYSCTKAALLMLTKCQALEYGGKNIRVNCIQPGLMPTGIIGSEPAEVQQALAQELGPPYQIFKELIPVSAAADLILFLSSSKARWITGDGIVADAGRSITHFAHA